MATLMDKIKAPHPLQPLRSPAQSLRVLGLLGVVNWMAHFYLARGFGLYEDDYSFISPAIGMDLHQLLALANHLHVLVAIMVVAPCVYGTALIGLGVIGSQDFISPCSCSGREFQTDRVNR